MSGFDPVSSPYEEESTCENDNSTDQDNYTSSTEPVTNSYMENENMGLLQFQTNGIPTHNYRNQIPQIVDDIDASTKNYAITLSPAKASEPTDVVNDDGGPKYKFGLAKNGDGHGA